MVNLNFKKLGTGEPLIILHGLYGSSDNWVSIARELMTDFVVYIVDLRNHGASPHLPEHNYQLMVDDLLEFMNTNEIYSATILGHSMGGKVAMFFTAIYPERVKRLVVVDISPRTYTYEKGDKQVNEHLEILNALASINLLHVESRENVEQKLVQTIASARIRQFLLKNLKRNKDGSFEWKINIEVLKQNLQNILIGLESEAAEFKLYKNPVLFIKGGKSDYIKFDDELMIKVLFPNAQITTIANASHWVHADEPDEFIGIIRKFMLG